MTPLHRQRLATASFMSLVTFALYDLQGRFGPAYALWRAAMGEHAVRRWQAR